MSVPCIELLGEPGARLLEFDELLADELVDVVSRLNGLYQTVDLLRVDGRAMFPRAGLLVTQRFTYNRMGVEGEERANSCLV